MAGGSVLKDGEWPEVNVKDSRKHHAGCVYLDGEWLFEAASRADLGIEGARYGEYQTDKAWFAEVGETATTVYANFGGEDPNAGLTEVNVRQTVFYPRQPFRNYITVRGFKMRHAAPPWAPPTLEQVALIGPNWSKGWIIENNEISHSINAGISLGKYGDEQDAGEASNEVYLDAIDRAGKQMRWDREHVGSHVVRSNEISWCEQAGIVGSLGCVYSEVRGNHIHHIHTQRRFGGAEMAGIKFHAPVDVLIVNNRIHDAFIGVWLDWMAQGARVSGNLLYRNDCHNMYYEVNHGPYLVDNNISILGNSRHLSQGGAFVHNLFDSHWGNWADERETPYFKPHSTERIGNHGLNIGDDRFHNNIFVGDGSEDSLTVQDDDPGKVRYYSYGLRCYEARPLLPRAGGNIYCHGAEPCTNETSAVISPGNPDLQLAEEGEAIYLEVTLDSKQTTAPAELVTTAQLGKAHVPQQEFTNPDGSPLMIDVDYFGRTRDPVSPTAGPFEDPGTGRLRLRVW